MLALIKNNTIVQEVNEGGWFELPNGDFISPVDGWSNGEYKLMEILPSDPVPNDMEVSDIVVKMIDGKPKYVVALVPIAVSDRVTSRQFTLQLLMDGLLDDVEGWVAAQDRATKIAYERSGTFYRHEPMMVAGFTALGFSEERVDKFFLDASKL